MLSLKPRLPRDVGKKHTQRRVICRAGPVLYEYLNEYVTNVCPIENIGDCVERMVVPLPEKQLWILQKLFEVRSSIDTQGLDGVFMKLFLVEDKEAIDALANALEVHSKSKEVIDSILKYTHDLPVDDAGEKI